jgi:hypothetical protein
VARRGGVILPTNNGHVVGGKDQKVFGGSRLDKAVQEGKQPPIYEDCLSMMLDDGKVPMFANQGCWLTCHDGERGLKAATNEDVAANAAMQVYKQGRRAQVPAGLAHRSCELEDRQAG